MTLIQIRSRARRIWISAQTRKTAGHTVLVTSLGLALAAPAGANPYLAKPSEVAQKIRVATCAISGGFMHLYTAVDQKLFNKYGLQVEFISISGSGISLAALSSHEIDLLYGAGETTIPAPRSAPL